jgi:putative peptide maturation system protein
VSDLKSIVVASVQGTDVSLHELLHTLNLQGRLTPLIGEAVVEKVIARAAAQEGIAVSDQELQKAADAFRLHRGLNKAADAQRWLSQNRLAPADLEEGLERELIRQKLADKVTRNQVEKYFAQNRAQFDRARLRHIVLAKEEIAQELLTRIHEEGADFSELARLHSVDARARAAGADLGTISRQAMPPDVAAAVFAAKNGQVVGPVKADGGYLLIEVVDILLGQLDPATSAAIQQILFRNWIGEQVQSGNVQVKLAV